MDSITPEQRDLARDIIEFELNSAYGWLAEFGYTPEIIIDTRQPGVVVPEYLKSNALLTLNISVASTQNLRFIDGKISFNTRFNRVPASCEIPYTALIAIMGREIKEFYKRPFHTSSVAILRAFAGEDKPVTRSLSAVPSSNTQPTDTATSAQEVMKSATPANETNQAPADQVKDDHDGKVTSLAAFRDRVKKK